MEEYRKPDPGRAAIEAWLVAHHGSPVSGLEPLAGGYWSAAWGYSVAGTRLVLRIGHSGEGYAIDAAAHRHFGASLPIPEVLHVGEGMGHHLAISRRHDGVVIEAQPTGSTAAVTERLGDLLLALRATPVPADLPVAWYGPRDRRSWRDWLWAAVEDRPGSTTHGWQQALGAFPEADAVYRACVAEVERLLPMCPERRDLVHGDLLHQNVLVSEDLATVTALFSWKCSVIGDWLHDLALCTHWAPWFPCIDADALRARLLDEDGDAVLRHRCYELQIAAAHVGWFVWTKDVENLERLVDNATMLLERG